MKVRVCWAWSLVVLLTPSVVADSCSGLSWSRDPICSDGFFLNPDGETCRDVNECAGELSENGTLSTDFENGCEVCNNICGGYKCSCNEGRVLDTDRKSCYDAFCPKALSVTVGGLEQEVNLDEALEVASTMTYPCGSVNEMYKGTFEIFCTKTGLSYSNTSETCELLCGKDTTAIVGTIESGLSTPEYLEDGAIHTVNCSDVNRNYTGTIDLVCTLGVLSSDTSSCEELCEPGEWSDAPGAVCSQTCREAPLGQIFQQRQILAGNPKCAPTERFLPCKVEQHCPIDCEVADYWTSWSQCSVTCGSCGIKQRIRPVVVEPAYGGKPCPNQEDLIEFEECYSEPPPCPESVFSTLASMVSSIASVPTLSAEAYEIKEPVCSDWEVSSECCSAWTKDECTETCGRGYRIETRETIEAGTGGTKCHPLKRKVECQDTECPLTTEIFRNQKCVGKKIAISPEDDFGLLETDEPHCRVETNLSENVPGFPCLQWAESLTENTTESEGGIVVFNFRILEEGSGSKAKCCFLLQDKDSEINMEVSTDETSCYKFVPRQSEKPSSFWF